MANGISPQSIGNRIRKLRKQKGYSQDDLAGYLEIPRSSVVNLEAGKRNISVAELIKLAELFGFSLDKFLSRDYEMEMKIHQVTDTEVAYQETRVSDPVLQVDKLKNVILYILERCGGKPNMGEKALYTLFYFCDFNFFEIYEDHLTGIKYRKLSSGPIPDEMDGVIRQMLAQGLLRKLKIDYRGYPQIKYLPMVKSDLTKLNAAEKEVIDQVIDHFSDWSTSTLIEYIQKDMPWRATEDGEFIEYELVFYRECPYSVRTYDIP